MLTDNSFFQIKETRGLSGYKSAWLYKDLELGKYCLVGATESVPYVFGDKDSFEFDILQSSTKGQIEGKPSLEPKDIEVLHHRDNAYRFGKMRGKIVDFMTINAEYVGYKYTGTLEYRPNDAEADVNRATVTITPMSADAVPLYNARDEIAETLCFASSIPATIKMNATFDISVTQTDASATYTMVKIANDGTETPSTALTSTDPKKATISEAGLFAIKVSDSLQKYASWITTVYVEA